MQLLTWMLIALHGGLSTAVAAPIGAELNIKNTASSSCPALQAPPFLATAGNERNLRGQDDLPERARSQAPSGSVSTEPSPMPSLTPASFDLRVGRLKPQVETLLRDHFAIQHIVWNAPEGLVWPSDFTLQASDVTTMVESLLQPYNLQMRVYANHTAVIQQLTHGAGL